MKLLIETSVNGFIIRDQNDGSEPEIVYTVANEDRAEATYELLGWVLELVGHIGSRYDEKRVHVIMGHGDKWISPEEAAKMLGNT
jgi:hypothetical protein